MSEALARKMKEIRSRYRAALPERLDEIDARMDGPAPGDAAMASVHRILHELCGTAGTIGEREVAAALGPAFAIAETCARDARARRPRRARSGTSSCALTWRCSRRRSPATRRPRSCCC